MGDVHMAITVRSRIDSELTRRVGSWFTVSELQSKLRVNSSTLKPLIMRYARDSILRRRRVRGASRSVEFSPAAGSTREFQTLLGQYMPYRRKGGAQKIVVQAKSSSHRATASKTKRSSASRA